MKLGLHIVAISLLARDRAEVAGQTTTSSAFNDEKFNELVSKIKGDVAALAQQVELLYASRCDDISLQGCASGNYDECRSLYRQQTCLGGPNYFISACAGGSNNSSATTCSGLWDFSISTVRIPNEAADGANGNPTNPQVIETVCFTRALDTWFQEKRANDSAYWASLGVSPRSMYFGSRNGAFRIYPARQSEVCGSYDPTLRPWCVAAASGPKNVIMILDTSGSMAGTRIELLKEAAKRVVNTLTVADRVALVLFNSITQTIVDPNCYMYNATLINKQMLTNAIDNITAGGKTNFYDAFREGFDILNRTATEEFTVPCNSAILFLTDGLMNEPPNVTEQQVLDLVTNGVEQASRNLGKPVLLFTYSVSETEPAVDNLPSQLACAVEYGVWSKIAFASDIVDSLSSYYQLFALGLGGDENADFVEWVEPYTFATGGILGTSVSKPVYDRSKSPYLFLGVVAIDFSLAALDAALGIQSGTGSEESIRRVSAASVARCPSLSLSLCKLEAYRSISSGGAAALCTNNCTAAGFVQVLEQKCPAISDYPSNLWDNMKLAGLSFEDRVCCKIGENKTSSICLSGIHSSPHHQEKIRPREAPPTYLPYHQAREARLT